MHFAKSAFQQTFSVNYLYLKRFSNSMAEVKKKTLNKEPVKKHEIKQETKAAVEDEDASQAKIPAKRLGNIFASILPLREEDKTKLTLMQDLLDHEDLNELKFLLKTHKARFAEIDFGTSHDFFQHAKYLTVACNVLDPSVKQRVSFLNAKIMIQEKERVFREFAPQADEKIISLIAPNIIGMDDIKRAGLIQLFAKEKVHILLLGDPATGKTDILRGIADLAPISSFGLGSGTSKAGLTMAVIGKEIVKGLLPLADNGIACIDELNLLRTADRAGLFNAMEKGFITYDKADSHLKLDTRVRIFATANPEGEKFVGRTVDVLKQQVPFDSALLSRFHLVFLIRKPSDKEFMQITNKIISEEKSCVSDNDRKFVKEFVSYALDREVELDKSLSPLIQGFVEDVRKDEGRFLVEISPRTVIGIMNMAKAAARMKLKEKVEREDIIRVLKIFNSALYIKKDEREL
jgi:DNA replicative helicase MCM subunit Mcm2 (Cdc46/Mcm family)